MKQLLQFKTFLLLAIFSLLTGTQAWAQDSPFYTLDATGSLQGKNNSYAGNCDIESGGITWNVTGNTTLNPWRIGGKSLSKVDRTVYTKTPMTKAVSKVALTVGTASSITVNSLKLTVASDADFTNVLDEVTATFAANSTIDFTPSTGSAWESGAYYKFTFNVSVSGSSNRYVQFSKVEIFEGTADPGDTRVVTTTTFPQSAYTAELGETFTAPTATVNDPTGAPISGAVVTYSSDNEAVATVDASTGAVTIVGAGTANITATYEGDDTAYKPSTGKYSLTVAASYNIAGFKALADNTTAIIKFVNAEVLAVSGTQYIWVRDASGALLIYNSGLSFTAGQVLNGMITTKKTTYKGQVETSGAIDGSGLVVTDGSTPSPVLVAEADAMNYDSDLVKISGVSVTVGTNVVIDGDNDITIYDGRFNLGYAFDATKTYDIVGIIGVYNTTNQIYPISVEEATDPGDTRIDPQLAFSESVINVALSEPFTAPTLSTVAGFSGEIEYESSNSAVARVTDLYTGDIMLVGGGTAEITATFAGDENYKPGAASYTINVSDDRIATTITQENINLDIDVVDQLTKLAPVVKDVTGAEISYTYGEWPTEVSFSIESDENYLIGSLDNNSGDITLNAVTGTATLKAYYNLYGVNTTYQPSECTFTITVTDPNAPGGRNNPYTVDDAISAIDAASGTTGVYATGIVSRIVTAYNPTFGNITYNISNDGSTTGSQLQAYRGKSYNGENFTSADDIKVGDIVVVYGNLTKYNTTYEFAQDNQLVSLQRPAAGPTFNPAAGEVAYETEVTITADEGNTLKYTTDGTDPATSETAVTTTTNTAVVTIYQDTEIRAIAYSASGDPSAEASANYTVAVRTPDAPVITPAGGGVEVGTVVTVSYSDPESTLLVTTDGSDPAEMGETVETYDFVTNADLEENGTLTVSYTINAATTIRAIVMDNVMGGLSAETTADFTIDLPTPTFQMLNDISGYTVKGNTIYSGDDASIQVYVIGSTNFATWYTLDGSDPTTSTTVKKITAATMNQRINMFHMPGFAVTLNQDGQTLRAVTYDAANNAFGPVADWGYTIKIGNPIVAAGTYAKVTSNADIEAGKNYILVYEDETAPQVFTGEISTTKTPYGLNVETTYSDVNEINISELTVTPVVIEANETSGYNLKVGEQYLAWSTGNSLKLQDDAYAWTIEVEDTEAKSSIASVATPERFLQYNTSSPRFACYTGSQKAVAIYKEVPASEAFEMLPITITSAGYSTLYYSDKDIELPSTGDGMTVRAYTMTFDGKKISEGDEFVSGDKIPAGTAVVLEEYNHEAITFEAKAYAPTIVANPTVENFLYGFDDDTDLELVFGAEGLKFYKLSGSPSGVIGFYWAKDNGAPFVSAAHKAALVLPADAASGIRGFDLADGTATAIKNVETSAAADGKIYDLQGRRVMNAQKGIYIINGKKVIK